MEHDLGKRAQGRGFTLSDQFGRIDPFCLVLILPMLLVGVVSLVAGVYLVVTAMVVGVLVIIGFDSWANRPWKLSRNGTAQHPRNRTPSRNGDLWDDSDRTGTQNRSNQSEQRSRPSQARPDRGPAPGRNAPRQSPGMAQPSGPPRGGPPRQAPPPQPAERSWPRVP